MEKEVKIKIAFAMIIGGIIGMLVEVILVSIFSSNEDIVFKNSFCYDNRWYYRNVG